MGKEISDGACRNLMGFLVSWHLAQMQKEPVGMRIVSRKELGLMEGEDTRMNDILSVEYASGFWRVEVRLPGGGRSVGSDPESFQKAVAKARQAGEESA